jgi:hypothetical protein
MDIGKIKFGADTAKKLRKDLQHNLELHAAKYSEWTLDTIVSKYEMGLAYSVITGAYKKMVKDFIDNANNNIPDKVSVGQAIEMTAGQYKNRKFKEFFQQKSK